jgi:hypothetical protein
MKENELKNRKPKEREHKGPEAEEVRGTVVQYLLNPQGKVDGLVLDDGIFIKFPPHLGRELMQVAQPNDEVTAIGRPEGAKLLKGYVIFNPRAETALRDIKPGPTELASSTDPLKPLRAEGKIKYIKFNPHGEIDGAILENRSILLFPPHVGDTFAELLKGGNQLHALGFGTSNQYGTTIGVAMLGSTKDSLTLIAPALHRPKKSWANKKREDEPEKED